MWSKNESYRVNNTNYNKTEATSIAFFNDCVSFSRPCIVEGMAKHWDAYNKWITKDKTDALDLENSYLIDMIGEDKLITVYFQNSQNETDERKMRWNWHNDRYSFKNDWQ